MGEKKIVKNTVSGKKVNAGSQSRSHQHKDNKPKFLFLRPGDTLPPHLSVLASADRTVSASSTIMSEAKELLRIRVQNLGGNAALEFSLERGETYHCMGSTTPASFTASGKPALVAREQEKAVFTQKRVPMFLNKLYDNNLSSRPLRDAPLGDKIFSTVIFSGLFVFVVALAWFVYHRV